MDEVKVLDLLRRSNEALSRGSHDAFLRSLPPKEREWCESHLSIGLAMGTQKQAMVIAEPHKHDVEHGSMKGTTWGAHHAWVQSKVDQGKLPQAALDELTQSTDKLGAIIGKEDVKRLHGLVIGYVQSGKTAHYTGMIARAIDAGYSTIIVLSGILNDLRAQTQERLIKDIVGWHEQSAEDIPMEACIPIEGRPFIEIQTSMTQDFNTRAKEVIAQRFVEAREQNKIILMVVKKNVTVLEHLLNGLKQCGKSELAQHRLLLIDDEADHATVNTGGSGEEVADRSVHEGYAEEREDRELETESDPSRTNAVLRRILHHFERFSYIGYTATPFANVLISPEESDDASLGPTLYPKDFIMNMKRPDTYFGPAEFFGTLDDPEAETESVCFVGEEEIVALTDLENASELDAEDAFPQLATAIDDFILTKLIRELRNEAGFDTGHHHTMLIHVSRLNVDQLMLTEKVEGLVEGRENDLSWQISELHERLKARWDAEFAQSLDPAHSWSQIQEKLDDEGREWEGSISVQTINSQHAEQRLVFGDEPTWTIAIGGNKLSRGLTLEGLCISYFVRKTRMYDSLMQMGRWFGYRPNYADLVRVYTTPELMEWFRWVILAEEQVRSDVHRYSLTGLSPKELAVRIPLHPERALRPASALKMKHARMSVLDWVGRTVQSVRLPVDDADKLEHNLAALDRFVRILPSRSQHSTKRMDAWDEIPAPWVADLLDALELPDAAFDPGAIAAFVREHLHEQRFVVTHPGTAFSDLTGVGEDLPHGHPSWESVNPRYIVRSQMKNIPGDVRVVSQPQDWDAINRIGMGLGNPPRLMFYLIAPGSKAKAGSATRVALPDHGLPIVALAIGFPGESAARIKEVVHVDGIGGTPDV